MRCTIATKGMKSFNNNEAIASSLFLKMHTKCQKASPKESLLNLL